MQSRPLPSAHKRASARSCPLVLLIGVDHRSAPLELREKVSYNPEDTESILVRLVATREIAEACLISTCNRTELYLRPADGNDDDDSLAYRSGFELAFLSRAPEIENEGRFYVKRGLEASQHLLRVASGLESMVLGEPEILGQVKRAAAMAAEAGASGTVLERLLRVAIRASGRARQETGISSGSVSFGYAVVDLARSIFQSLESCSVLMLGAGETARQVARNLTERGARELVVANRSPQRAEEFRQLFAGSRIVPFGERDAALARTDVVVASTGADEPIVTRAAVAAAQRVRRNRPLLVVDLGVPRNVETAVGELGSVFLQDIDSLEDLIARNLKRRRDEVPRVDEILEHELKRFDDWCRSLAAEPLVAQLQRQAEKIRQQALLSVRDRFPEETHRDLEQLTRSLVKRLLHHPSLSLRNADGHGQGHDVLTKLDVVRELFHLDEDEDEADDNDHRDENQP